MDTSLSKPQVIVPRWQYEAWKRWFNNDTAQESRKIKADAERQAGER